LSIALVAPDTVHGVIGDAKCGFFNSLILLAFNVKRNCLASSKLVAVADCSNCAQSKYWYSLLAEPARAAIEIVGTA
jgi:hypothetical protein